jgi:hypothetical protein
LIQEIANRLEDRLPRCKRNFGIQYRNGFEKANRKPGTNSYCLSSTMVKAFVDLPGLKKDLSELVTKIPHA